MHETLLRSAWASAPRYRRVVYLPLVASLLLLFAACTSDPIPKGYSGPLARITDSSTTRSTRSVDFFFLEKIDGRQIEESLSTTNSENYGRGLQMTPVVIGRQVPAVASTFTIVGRTHYAAPILELLNKTYEISGEVRFTPEPNKNYRVRGVLGDDYSAIWIEDDATDTPVAPKIEIKGSTALGILQK